MADLNDSVTLKTCVEKLKYNKQHYSNKGLDMQIFFVAQLFKLSYENVAEEMEKINCV